MSKSVLDPTLGLYLHIPWCPTRCIYCDFNTYIDGEPALKTRYQQALLREIRESASTLNHPALDTIFFGGGTPTTVPANELLQLVDTIHEQFQLVSDAEITTEANPGTLSLEYLRTLRQGAINRLSLGVQSFDNNELAFLSRLHDADTARRAVDLARQAGFDNLSLDLIFNLPDQTTAQWVYTLEEALKLEPDHLSIYSLIVELGTPLHRQVTSGSTTMPDDDIGAEMYELTMTRLAEAGFCHYEISNWVKDEQKDSWQTPPLASAHNLIYWRNQPYLGLGAGAHGTVQGERWMNVKRPQSYIQQVETGSGLGLARDERSYEQLDQETAMTEHLMLGLRLLQEGVSATQFEQRFGQSLTDRYKKAIQFGLDQGWLEWGTISNDQRLRLTRQGRFFANQVVLQFMG